MVQGFLSAAGSVLLILLFFGVAVFVHELGHFLVARRCGMKVKVFSIGFGPAVWKRVVDGIEYRISWLPLGGYVALPQMDPSGDSLKEDGAAPLPYARPIHKILVGFAGVACNMILAYALAWIVYIAGEPAQPEDVNTVIGYVSTNEAVRAQGIAPGDTIVSVNGRKVGNWEEIRFNAMLATQAVLVLRSQDGSEKTATLSTDENALGMLDLYHIGPMSYSAIRQVAADSPAEVAGLKPGDLVLAAAGQQLFSWGQFVEIVAAHADRPLALTVLRGQATNELTAIPVFDDQEKRARIGVAPNTEYAAPGVLVHRTPTEQIGRYSGMIFRFLKALVTPEEAPKAAQGVGGPVSIFWVLWMKIQVGIIATISFAVFFNVNLAILNLLPLPVLDGGHILLALYEGVTRRPANRRMVMALWNATAILLIGLMLFLTFRDFSLIRRVNTLRAASGTNTSLDVTAPTNSSMTPQEQAAP